MRNIKIIYRYDGSDFYGFQRQPNRRTVQGEVEKALKIILKTDINLVSAGRTDRGVHALMQVSNFPISSTIPKDRLFKALFNLLPMDIDLLSLEEVSDEFHSRFGAISRAYRYKMTWKKNTFTRRYISYTKEEIDVKKFEEIMQPLIGRHNFENFRMSDCVVHKPIREIWELSCTPIEDGLEVYIKGNAFLKSQIRIIIGTALLEYHGKVEAGHIAERLAHPEKEYSKLIADGSGLYLCDVEYKGDKLGISRSEE